MIFYDTNRNRLELATEMGRGGEASIYSVRGRKDLVAKIYHRPPYEGYAQKLAWMQKHPPKDPSAKPGHATIAWPLELLYNHSYRLSGYLMPYMDGTVKLIHVINPLLRAKILPNFNWKYLVRSARNLVSAVNALHDRSYVIGDLNESNVLISPTAMVTLIDVDSFQVHTLNDNQIYCCPVGKPEYTPPELQGVNFQKIVRKKESDYFALGVLIFQLLMQGSHPYRGRWMGKSEPPQISEKIKNGWFPYNGNNGMLRPPPNVPPLEILSPLTRELFVRCFVNGYKNPSARPSPRMWMEALDGIEANLKACPKGHYYYRSLPKCPWCSQRRKKIFVAPVPKPQGMPKLAVRKGVVYMGVVAHGESTRSLISIKNEGTAALTGSIQSDRKWLQVSNARFNIAPGEVKRLDLYANTRTLRTNAKGSSHQAALKIESNGGTQRLRVRIRVGMPVLQVEPKTIDFGSMILDDVAQKSVHIKNVGSGMLTGKVTVRSAWLNASPSQFSCLPGAGIVVTFQADSNQPLDASKDGNCFSSAFITSNGGYQSVRAQMHIASPHLSLSEGRVQLENVTCGEKKYFSIKVKNTGAGELRGSVQTKEPWIKAQTSSFHIGPDRESKINLYADTGVLDGSPHGRSHSGRVLIKSNDGDHMIPVSVIVTSPEITLKKNDLDLGLIDKNAGISGQFSVQNTGMGSLQADISTCDPWLSFPETDIHCEAGKEVVVPFTLTTKGTALPARRDISTEAVIASGQEKKSIQFHFSLDVPIQTIHFHENERISSGFQGKSIIRFLIQNPSQCVLAGRVESGVPWLQVAPGQFQISANAMETIGCTIDRGLMVSNSPVEMGSITVTSNAATEVISLQINRQTLSLRVIERKLFLPLGENQGMVFQCVPAGEFLMGESTHGSQSMTIKPPRGELLSSRLFLDEFWIGKHPVTNSQYRIFTASSSYLTPGDWENGACLPGQEQHPVSGVNWTDALAFCEWMQGLTAYPIRLPTEAQWEKAARGNDGRVFPWGNDRPGKERCNYEGNGMTIVGHYGESGESPFGAGDMSGNVWEWTSSQSKPYPYQADDGREELDGDFNRILRGGSWFSSENQIRVTSRLRGKIDQKENIFGFRCSFSF